MNTDASGSAAIARRSTTRLPLLVVSLVMVAGFGAWQFRDALIGDAGLEPIPQGVASPAGPASAATVATIAPVLHLGARSEGGAPTKTLLGAPTIKAAPTQVAAFDGKQGAIVIDPRAIDALRHGEYVYARYGEHLVAHRVHRKERRGDHTYVAMAGVDPVDGGPLATYASYHLYDDGTVSHSVNHEGVVFEVRGMAGESIAFENLRANDAPADSPHAH